MIFCLGLYVAVVTRGKASFAVETDSLFSSRVIKAVKVPATETLATVSKTYSDEFNWPAAKSRPKMYGFQLCKYPIGFLPFF